MFPWWIYGVIVLHKTNATPYLWSDYTLLALNSQAALNFQIPQSTICSTIRQISRNKLITAYKQGSSTNFNHKDCVIVNPNPLLLQCNVQLIQGSLLLKMITTHWAVSMMILWKLPNNTRHFEQTH